MNKDRNVSWFLPEASFGPRVLSLPASRTTKFGQKVQNNLVKVPIVFFGGWGWGAIDLDPQGQIKLEKPNLPHAITHHLVKLEPPN